VEEIHGRSEHVDYVDKAPNVRGKAGRKSCEAGGQGQEAQQLRQEGTSQPRRSLEEALRRESEEAGLPVPSGSCYPSSPAKRLRHKPSKGRKRHVEDDDDNEDAAEDEHRYNRQDLQTRWTLSCPSQRDQ
jgi:hypothetical protein